MWLLGILSAVCNFLVKAIVTAVKIIYRLLKLLHIRILTLFLCVCGVVQLAFGFFSSYPAVVYFWFGLIVCLLITLISWLYTLRTQHFRRKEARMRKKADREEKERIMRERLQERQTKKIQEQSYPVYYEAAGHTGYVFAEYTDRYELYRNENGKLVYIRTDFKYTDKEE